LERGTFSNIIVLQEASDRGEDVGRVGFLGHLERPPEERLELVQLARVAQANLG